MIPYKYSLEDFDFVALSKQSRDPREKRRLLILANLQDGKRQADIADMLKISVPTVKRAPRRFKESGVDELSDRPRSGAPAKLPPSEHTAFKEHILQLRQEVPGGRLTGYDVLDVPEKKRRVKCSLSTAYNLMHDLDLSRISRRSRHPKQNEEVREAFKKTSEKQPRPVRLPVLIPSRSISGSGMKPVSDSRAVSQECGRRREPVRELSDNSGLHTPIFTGRFVLSKDQLSALLFPVSILPP